MPSDICRVDPHLRRLIKRIGHCGLTPRPDRFGTLVNSIVAQQISSKAAASINLRLHALGGQPHQPARLLELGEPALRSVGLSASKARYVLNLAEAVASGAVPLDAFDDSWDDAAIVATLTSIKGIGVWTAEMFLIFSLNRPDVLPAHDLGVRAALRDRHGLAALPRPAECHVLARSGDLIARSRAGTSGVTWTHRRSQKLVRCKIERAVRADAGRHSHLTTCDNDSRRGSSEARKRGAHSLPSRPHNKLRRRMGGAQRPG